MQEIKQYKEEFLRDLELVHSVPLNLREHGFNYTRDDDRESLDDSTIFNSLLKTKRFRGLEIKKKWVKLKIAEYDNKYYLLTYDVRKDDDYPQILKLVPPVDNVIINHIKNIMNPSQLATEESLKISLKNIAVTNLASIGATSDNIIESPDELIKVTGKIMSPFEVYILFDTEKNEINNKNMVAFKVTAENGETYFSKMFYVNEINELDALLKEHVLDLSDTLKETIRNVSVEDLRVRKSKSNEKKSKKNFKTMQ